MRGVILIVCSSLLLFGSAITSCGRQAGKSKIVCDEVHKSDVDTLIDRMRTCKHPQAFAAAKKLALQGPSTLPKVIPLLQRNEPYFVRGYATIVLGDIGAPAVEPLLRIYSLKNYSKPYVIEALGRIGPAAQKAVPRLVLELKSPNHRMNAAQTLGQIAENAEPALPALREELNSPDRRYRQIVRNAIRRIEESIKRNNAGRNKRAPLP